VNARLPDGVSDTKRIRAKSITQFVQARPTCHRIEQPLLSRIGQIWLQVKSRIVIAHSLSTTVSHATFAVIELRKSTVVALVSSGHTYAAKKRTREEFAS
jgi:hypothetical protein